MSDASRPVMLIAGGSGSIGSEIAAQAAASGWSVALHGRRAETTKQAAERVRSLVDGSVISEHCADFADSGAIERLVDAVAGTHGRLDALIDCSVGGPPGVTGLFADTDPAAYAGLATQSVVTFQRLCHAALPLLAGSFGTMIAMVSDAGIFAAPRQTMIGAMRAATIGFVRNLAVELAPQGVRIHAASTSFVEGTRIANELEAASASRMETARKRAGLGLPTAADIAALALFLCGDSARHMTGQVISVNGGLNA